MTGFGPGIDYAFFPHPSIAAMNGAGVKFACRYISTNPANDTSGKNLLPGETRTLLGAGFQIVVVVEEGASYMLGGHSAGVTAAKHADAVVKALGMPGIPVYIAADFDATPAQQAPINACLDGFASVVGRDRTGLYGGFWPVSRAFDAGKCRYGWQTIAWSGGQWDHRAHIRQGLSFSLGGASVDHDQAIYADFGQWPRPKVAPLPDPHKHATVAGDTIASVAAGRGMDPVVWLGLQDRLGTNMHALTSGPLKPGTEWRTVGP